MMTTSRVIEVLENKILETDDENFKTELLEAVKTLNNYAFVEAFKKEIEYVFEDLQEYDDEGDYANITLTEEDVEEMADSLSTNDWLNEQIYECVRDTVFERVSEKQEKEGDDFNE
jgi:hypothetical protein